MPNYKIDCAAIWWHGEVKEVVSDEELTRRLMGKDFGSGLKGKPLYWKSLVTEKEYLYSEFTNIDKAAHGYFPLPKDEYPYTLVYVDSQ